MTEELDPYLDPDKNKCITCGLFRIYTDPKFDALFSNIGKLYEAGKINYKINRRIIGPEEATIFCSAGLPQAMKINESCQFHQSKLDYPIEHYPIIHSATLTMLLTEETKNLTLKTKRLATIAIYTALGIGLLQICIGWSQIEISSPGWTGKVIHNLLALFSCR